MAAGLPVCLCEAAHNSAGRGVMYLRRGTHLWAEESGLNRLMELRQGGADVWKGTGWIHARATNRKDLAAVLQMELPTGIYLGPRVTPKRVWWRGKQQRIDTASSVRYAATPFYATAGRPST
jgi:hypothetical protein